MKPTDESEPEMPLDKPKTLEKEECAQKQVSNNTPNPNGGAVTRKPVGNGTAPTRKDDYGFSLQIVTNADPKSFEISICATFEGYKDCWLFINFNLTDGQVEIRSKNVI